MCHVSRQPSGNFARGVQGLLNNGGAFSGKHWGPCKLALPHNMGCLHPFPPPPPPPPRDHRLFL